MAYTTTTNYGLKKGSGGSGQTVEQQRVYDNENADTIDSTMKAISDATDAAQADANTAQSTADTAQGEVDALENLVSTNRTSTLKSISTVDTAPTDYLAHLFTVTGYAQNQAMPNNADGKALWSIKGLTATNMVSGESVANGGSVSFASVTGNKYYDTLNNVILTGTGSTMTATNVSGATASMMIIDLNVLGFQAKTAGELAVIFPYYFDTTRSTFAGLRLFGRGKNLFDKWKATLNFSAKSDGTIAPLVGGAVSDFIKLQKGNVCVQTSVLGSGAWGVHVYDVNKTYKLFISGGSENISFTMPIDGYVRCSLLLTSINSWQLELGSTATPYEPYLSCTAYTPQGTLRSVPSASDEVYSDADGRTWKTKRVSDDYALVAWDIDSLATAGTNRDYVRISYDIFTNFLPQPLAYAGKIRIPSISTEVNAATTAGWDTVNQLFTWAQSLDIGSPTLYIYFPKGTYANLAAAQTALAGTIIRYELATPITTELETIGNLIAYPNGSITTEPCYSGYATGASTIIGTASLPIKAIRKVESISLDANGNAVRTDVTASCSVDTTTLTITGYDASKVYFYDLDIDTKYTTSGLKTYQVECPTGIVTHDFAAGATSWMLTANEAKATMFSCTNAGGAANVIMPAKDGKVFVLKNTSGQTLTVKTASSTGVTIATAKTATFVYMGTDFIKLSEV